MPITAIARDWGPNLSIVRMLTTDSLATIQTANYLLDQQPVIDALNGGTFQWSETDYIFVKASDGWGQFTISDDFSSLTLFAVAGGGGGSGTVTSVTAGAGLTGGTITTSGIIALNRALIQQAAYNYSTDTGVDGTAYIATLSPAAASLTDGLLVYLLPANTNSVNNPTLNVNGHGAKTIVADAYNLNPIGQSDIQQGTIAELQYCLALDKFLLLNPQLTMAAPFNVQDGLYDVTVSDTGIVNAYIGDSIFYPGSSAWSRGARVYFVPGNTNSGASTFAFAGLSVLPIHLGDGSALSGGEMQAGKFSLLILLPGATAWQLVNPFSAGGGGGVTAGQVQQLDFNYGIAGGTANALTLALSPAIAGYAEPLTIYFQAIADNTAIPTSINVNGKGAVNLYTHGLDGQIPVFPGAIITGNVYEATYDGTNNHFIVTSPSNSVVQQLISNQNLVFAADSGIANTYALTLPTIYAPGGNYVDGLHVSFTTTNANSGASTMNINGIGASAIVHNNGAALSAGDIIANAVYELTYNAVTGGFVLLNPPASGGGSSPWSAGTATGSAVGGDGTSTTLGNYSLVYGDTNCSAGASAINSFTQGTTCINLSAYGFVMGYQCQAQGVGASAPFCMGNACITDQGYNFAFGSNCQALGTFSLAIGNGAIASSNYARAFGNGVTAGIGCFVAGDRNSSGLASTGGDQFVLGFDGGYWFYRNTSGTPELAVHFDAAGNLINCKGTADQSKSVQTPLAGDSITIADNSKTLILDPAGTLLTLTITTPANPIDGQEIRVSSSQVITTLTFSPNAGQTLSNAPTTMAAGSGFAYIYDLAGTNWYRLY